MKRDASVPAASLLQDLTEGTQALGNYLGALQARLTGKTHGPPPSEILDRSLRQYERIARALHDLGPVENHRLQKQRRSE
ncbi:MAG: hypothetical protein KGO02_07805 [Alphaproteobacteria bacterium]|nr:hypothetical protein [Alphaproteobacteria bacterium]